eukprot:TRINITY_DN42321_c0_g1_i1.p1 TRINITY_DN42321_c0_g1~~TRINITY_DN42321_c0_g1_i1.p1  ORF type:complete len:185 (+),score=31.93 TRINITY_DN42321_c0_g1_i1:94-648(+)
MCRRESTGGSVEEIWHHNHRIDVAEFVQFCKDRGLRELASVAELKDCFTEASKELGGEWGQLGLQQFISAVGTVLELVSPRVATEEMAQRVAELQRLFSGDFPKKGLSAVELAALSPQNVMVERAAFGASPSLEVSLDGVESGHKLHSNVEKRMEVERRLREIDYELSFDGISFIEGEDSDSSG